MEDIFIESIDIFKLRNFTRFDLLLSKTERKNLIITGKNGSGKTTLLNELSKYLNHLDHIDRNRHSDTPKGLEAYKKYKLDMLNSTNINQDTLLSFDNHIKHYRKQIEFFGGTIVKFNNDQINEYFKNGNFLIAFFEAKRESALNTPRGIDKIELRDVYRMREKARVDFIQYIVNLKAERSFAKDDNDFESVRKIDEWFNSFENKLFELFDSHDMRLEFDRTSYNFNIIENGKEPYNFNQLSDGYSAILSIVTELIMRMEEHKSYNIETQGVVLIDEIETHLHVDLQKKILPFLISFFPKVQFIVTTHSPFVLNSIENSVIFDIEKKILTSDLSGYSYDTLIESFFNSDNYSELLKERVKEYEKLLENLNLNESEKEKLFFLNQYLNEIPKFVADELAVKLQQIKLNELNRKK